MYRLRWLHTDAPPLLMENKLNQNEKIERALCTLLMDIIMECNAQLYCSCARAFLCALHTIYYYTCTPILIAELHGVGRFYGTIKNKTEVALYAQRPK